MDLTIHDLAISELSKFQISELSNTDEDGVFPFVRVTRKPAPFNNTVDLLMTVRNVAVDSCHLVIVFPNNEILAVPLPSYSYLKLEVM